MTTLTLANWTQYYNLTKPKVVFLIVFTAMVGMLLAAEGAVALDIFVFGLCGIGLAAASGAAINHVVDEHIDRIMERTRNRPLVSGELDQKSALVFALSIGALGIAMLVVFVNPLTAGDCSEFCVNVKTLDPSDHRSSAASSRPSKKMANCDRVRFQF